MTRVASGGIIRNFPAPEVLTEPSSAIEGQSVAPYLVVTTFFSLLALGWIYISISHRLRYWRAGGPPSGMTEPASRTAVFGVVMFLIFFPTFILLFTIKNPGQPVVLYFVLMIGGAGLTYMLARFMVWTKGERGRAADIARAQQRRRSASDPQALGRLMMRMPLWFFGGLFFVASALFLAIIIFTVLDKGRQAQWPGVDAVVVNSSTAAEEKKTSQQDEDSHESGYTIHHFYCGHIRFAYVVNGVHYEKESAQLETSDALGEVQNRLRAYATGTHHLIRYRPDDAQYIVHQAPETIAQAGGIMIACGVLLFIGAGMMWLAHRMAMSAELDHASSIVAATAGGVTAAPSAGSPTKLDTPEAAASLLGSSFYHLSFAIGKAMLGFLGLIVVAVGLLWQFSYRKTRDWPSTSATVVGSRMTEEDTIFDKGRRTDGAYEVEVEFRYTIAGAEHDIWVTVHSNLRAVWAQADLNRYPRGSTQVISYNVANPDDILVGPVRDPGSHPFIAIAFGVFLVIASGWWIWYGLRATRSAAVV